MKIAIIGSGISGLGAAYCLHPSHEITLYEKNDYCGGHSRTIDVPTPEGAIPVDTGFIVFNHRNYPLLTALFKHLNVRTEPSDMSFGVSINNGWLEYATCNIRALLAQKSNLLRADYWRMLCDVLRFNRKALSYLEQHPDATLGQCLDDLRMGEWFRQYYILAMGGAIWSCPIQQMLEFPARTFIRFFENHGLLTISDQPQWYTVTGGSREYVKALTAPFRERILLNRAVRSVTRTGGEIQVEDMSGTRENFDHVIFACHADQALALLTDASDEEKSLMGKFSYQANRVVVHRDTSFMPKRRAAWASWIYLSESVDDTRSGMSLSYWMNNLQNLKTETPVLVTLNPDRMPDPEKTYDQYDFEHPVFDDAAIRAQAVLDRIQGQRNTWFCGAYQRYGFHEDGLMSAVTVAEKLGARIPWK